MHCLQHEGDLPKAPLHPIVATAPLDLLHIDFTSIKMTMELNQLPRVANILVFQNHFMKHIMAYVTPDLTAKTVTKFLYQGYILIFGALARLLGDQGAKFMSSIIDKLCMLLGMKKLQTMPYHPQTNGWGIPIPSLLDCDRQLLLKILLIYGLQWTAVGIVIFVAFLLIVMFLCRYH